MSNDDDLSAYERGARKMAEVYAGEAVVLPEGTMAFTDVMMKTLFAEVWTRDVLSVRDRRLLLLGVIASGGLPDLFGIQARAALANEELTPDELREVLVFLAPYAGYPKVSGLIPACESAIHAARQRDGG
jgi:4-carboxymuconolactone decarboxylase